MDGPIYASEHSFVTVRPGDRIVMFDDPIWSEAPEWPDAKTAAADLRAAADALDPPGGYDQLARAVFNKLMPYVDGYVNRTEVLEAAVYTAIADAHLYERGHVIVVDGHLALPVPNPEQETP